MSSQLFKSLKQAWHNQGTFKFYNSCVVFRPRVGYNRGIAVSASQTARKEKITNLRYSYRQEGSFPHDEEIHVRCCAGLFSLLLPVPLTAAALYLYHREKELDEYERLLFSDDGDDYGDDDDFQDDTVYEKDPRPARSRRP